jgi:hypothetical protein
MNGKNIRKVSHGCHYFFVRPGRNENLHKAAARLMGIRKVTEVAITEGEYGFVVKAHGVQDVDRAIVREIARAVGGSSRKAVCHCRYVRN